MKQNEIYELMDRFADSSLGKLEIVRGDFQILMEKEKPAQAGSLPQGWAFPPSVPLGQTESFPPAGGVQQNGSQQTQTAEAANPNFEQVKSPIVGIYYAAPSSEEAPFVTCGQRVQQGQVLCLVEAMKMMNELKSPVTGIIRKMSGINGELVEYDQVLFEVEPC